MKRLLYILIICLWASLGFAGTSYYVDCSDTGSTDQGTFAEPWNSLADLAAAGALSTGDDIYFKVNTTCTLTADAQRVVIDWTGTVGDRVIIGAYYGDGQFGLNGNNRPIFDGQRVSGAAIDTSGYPGGEQFLIGSIGYDYITIKDLKVINSGGYGILSKTVDYGIIDNCVTSNSNRLGIGISGSFGTVSNNNVSDAYDSVGNGDCLDSQGNNHTITGNVVYDCNEGIGVYGFSTYAIIEYNVVYDSDYSIYIDAGKYNTIRYNLVYTSATGTPRGRGISFDNELGRNLCHTGDNYVHGNVVAAMTQGIFISNACGDHDGSAPYLNCDTSCNTNNMLIYNNTLVDNNINIRIVFDDAGWTGNEIKNNISYILTTGLIHNQNDSPSGFTWSNNLFNDDIDLVTGDAGASNVSTDVPGLTKTSGWRSLTAEAVNGTEYSLSPGSVAIDAAVAIPSYNDRITAADYTADPIEVTTEISADPDIGAWEYRDSPYGDSTTITDISWDWENALLPADAIGDGADIWAMTWGSDGSLYTVWGDGWGFDEACNKVSMGISTVTGIPASPSYNDVCGSTPCADSNFCRANYPEDGNGKGSSIISIGGVLYMWVNLQDPQPSTMKIFYSSDDGETWSEASWTLDGEDFGVATFLNYGQDNDGAGSYVYSYGIDDGITGPPTDHTEIYIARVPTASILTQGSWEWRTASGWSSNINDKVSVFTNSSEGVDFPLVIHHNDSNRYILTSTHLVSGSANIQGLGVFESENPWGPWLTITYVDNWGSGYTSGEPLGYHMPTATGWSGSGYQYFWFSSQNAGSMDNLNWVKLSFTINLAKSIRGVNF